MEQRSWSSRAWRLGIRFLAALGFVFLLVTVTPIDAWWARALAGESYSASGDVLILLSGAMLEDGTLGWSSYLRTLYAGRNYRPGGFRQVVVTGGRNPWSATPVALPMAEFLKCLGVPADALRLETAARSTRENALFSKPLLDNLPGRKVLLTSDYHMFRARRVFAKLGLEVWPQPVPDVEKRASQPLERWPAFLELVKETGKIAYYWVRGWM
jgi:uncharacterized SAM-binding protein YcdF (DUF218 family)